MQCGDVIKIIQGDTVCVEFAFSGLDYSAVDKFIFSSNELEIEKECEYIPEEDIYLLSLDPSETETLSSGTTNYDITIKLLSGSIYTVVYEQSLVVLQKNNRITEEE